MPPLGSENNGEPQVSQKLRPTLPPFSPSTQWVRAWPLVTLSAGRGTIIASVGAPPDVYWQSRQWHATWNTGSAVSSYLTAPQRHPPVRLTIVHLLISQFSRPGADVGDIEVRLFHGGEMATLGLIGPAHDIVGPLGPSPRGRLVQRLAREIGEGGGRLQTFALLQPNAVLLRQGSVIPGAGGEAAGHHVDHHVGEQLIEGEVPLERLGLAVGPVIETLDDPRRLANRVAGRHPGQRLRLGHLQAQI